MSVYMMVEKCPSLQTTCQKCWRRISVGALRVRRSAYCSTAKYYHLACYKPGEPRAVDFEKHVSLKRISEEKDVEKVKKWVERWNKRFVMKEENVPEQYKTKAVTTCSTSLRRLLLESFQYLDIPDIEQSVAFVCKEWFHITRDNEFWKTRFVSQFPSTATDEKDIYRTKFIVRSMGCCWVCHRYLSLDKLKLICPFRRRPLCTDCFITDEGCIVTVNSYCHRRNISLSLISRLKIRHFTYHKLKQNYLSELANSILPYAEQRRQALLAVLQSESMFHLPEDRINAIRNFDLKAYYKSRFGVHGRLPYALGVLCGRNDQQESWLTSITNFLGFINRD